MQLLLMGGRFDPNRHFFAQSDPGDWWDASDLPLMYQDSAGTTGSAVNQPVGLMLGQLKKGQRGAEFWNDASVSFVANSSRVSAGVYRIYSPTGSESADVLHAGITVGRWYEVAFNIDSVAAAGGGIRVGSSGGGVVIAATVGQKRCFALAETPNLAFKRVSGVTDVQISNVSFREVPGIHRYQTTSANRPTLKQDGGYYSEEYNGTNSYTESATGGGGTTGFFFCAAVKVNGGAGTVRQIWSDGGTASGHIVYINASNQLEYGAGNGVTRLLATTAATLPVGETHVVTAWQDGANICSQIDGGTVASAAFGAATAGSAGFTLGKSNTAASGYLNGRIYCPIYRYGTPVTASQRERVKRFVAARAGVSL